MIKKGNDKKKKVDSSTRAHLIRKGNQFLSEGKIEQAEKIFVTVDYKDGLVRLGDYYLEHNDIYKSAQMYFMSENVSKISAFCKRSALIIEKYLEDSKDRIYEKIIHEKK